jgi:hypothetical protein
MSQPATAATHAAETTGHPLVDEVLTSLARLDHLPVADHAVIFEAAHERLREALSGPLGSAGSLGSAG